MRLKPPLGFGLGTHILEEKNYYQPRSLYPTKRVFKVKLKQESFYVKKREFVNRRTALKDFIIVICHLADVK